MAFVDFVKKKTGWNLFILAGGLDETDKLAVEM